MTIAKDSSAFEGEPAWDCDHLWMNVNSAYLIYSSISTDSAPPEDVPYSQKQQCLKCYGYRIISVPTKKE